MKAQAASQLRTQAAFQRLQQEYPSRSSTLAKNSLLSSDMKYTLVLFALAAAAIAAPVAAPEALPEPEAAPEPVPGYGDYGKYGKYASYGRSSPRGVVHD